MENEVRALNYDIDKAIREKCLGRGEYKLRMLVAPDKQRLLRPSDTKNENELFQELSLPGRTPETMTHCFVGAVDWNGDLGNVGPALECGLLKIKTIGGNMLRIVMNRCVSSIPSRWTPESPVMVVLYANLTLEESIRLAVNDNVKSYSCRPLLGFRVADLYRGLMKKFPARVPRGVNGELKYDSKRVELEIFKYFGVLTPENVTGGWKCFKYFAEYPVQYEDLVERVTAMIANGGLKNCPQPEILFGKGKISMTFGYYEFKRLMAFRLGDWEGIMEDLADCLSAGDFDVLKRSHKVRSENQKRLKAAAKTAEVVFDEEMADVGFPGDEDYAETAEQSDSGDSEISEDEDTDGLLRREITAQSPKDRVTTRAAMKLPVGYDAVNIGPRTVIKATVKTQQKKRQQYNNKASKKRKGVVKNKKERKTVMPSVVKKTAQRSVDSEGPATVSGANPQQDVDLEKAESIAGMTTAASSSGNRFCCLCPLCMADVEIVGMKINGAFLASDAAEGTADYYKFLYLETARTTKLALDRMAGERDQFKAELQKLKGGSDANLGKEGPTISGVVGLGTSGEIISADAVIDPRVLPGPLLTTPLEVGVENSSMQRTLAPTAASLDTTVVMESSQMFGGPVCTATGIVPTLAVPTSEVGSAETVEAPMMIPVESSRTDLSNTKGKPMTVIVCTSDAVLSETTESPGMDEGLMSDATSSEVMRTAAPGRFQWPDETDGPVRTHPPTGGELLARSRNSQLAAHSQTDRRFSMDISSTVLTAVRSSDAASSHATETPQAVSGPLKPSTKSYRKTIRESDIDKEKYLALSKARKASYQRQEAFLQSL